MRDMRGQDREKCMPILPTTFVYNLPVPNRDHIQYSSSSKLSSPTLVSTIGQRNDQPSQTRTLIFSDTSQHHHLYYSPSPLPPNPLQQPHIRPRKDPDPPSSSSPIPTTTCITSTPIIPIPNPPRTTTTIRYRECLKNHAASMGGHVTDGCGEFMPSGEENTPQYLICAACECHRNFHRKEAEGEPQHGVFNYRNSPPHLLLPTPPFSSLHHHHRLSPTMVAFGGSSGGGPAESSSEDLNMFQSNDGGQLSVQPQLSKKRFRTKFTQQQKESMMEFAEKLGWKIQKQDEKELEQFCSQVGLNRNVFKVWMHNSKQAMKKKHM